MSKSGGESNTMMAVHGIIIGLILYVVLKYIVKQPNCKAVRNSIIVGLAATIYMILFGHRLPSFT